MFWREVQGAEIVPVVLNVGTLRNCVADFAEDIAQPVGHNRNRVPCAGRDAVGGTGEVVRYFRTGLFRLAG